MPDEKIGYAREVGLAGGIDLKASSPGDVKPNSRVSVPFDPPEGCPAGPFSNLATDWSLLERGVVVAGMRSNGGSNALMLINTSNKRFPWSAGTKLASVSFDGGMSIHATLECTSTESSGGKTVPMEYAAPPPASEVPDDPPPIGKEGGVQDASEEAPAWIWRVVPAGEGFEYHARPISHPGYGRCGFCFSWDGETAAMVDTPVGGMDSKPFTSVDAARAFCDELDRQLHAQAEGGA